VLSCCSCCPCCRYSQDPRWQLEENSGGDRVCSGGVLCSTGRTPGFCPLGSQGVSKGLELSVGQVGKCMSANSLPMNFRAKLVGSAATNRQSERWQSFCVECDVRTGWPGWSAAAKDAASASIHWYSSSTCDSVSLVRRLDLHVDKCSTQVATNRRYWSVCDVFSKHRCPRPSGALVVRRYSRPAGSSVTTAPCAQGFVSSNVEPDVTIIASVRTSALSLTTTTTTTGPSWVTEYRSCHPINTSATADGGQQRQVAAEVLRVGLRLGLLATAPPVRSVRVCCTSLAVRVHYFTDAACSARDRSQPGVEYKKGCHLHARDEEWYDTSCSSVTTEGCPAIPQALSAALSDASAASSEPTHNNAMDAAMVVVLVATVAALLLTMLVCRKFGGPRGSARWLKSKLYGLDEVQTVEAVSFPIAIHTAIDLPYETFLRRSLARLRAHSQQLWTKEALRTKSTRNRTFTTHTQLAVWHP
jgi:hypothetical protein